MENEASPLDLQGPQRCPPVSPVRCYYRIGATTSEQAPDDRTTPSLAAREVAEAVVTTTADRRMAANCLATRSRSASSSTASRLPAQRAQGVGAFNHLVRANRNAGGQIIADHSASGTGSLLTMSMLICAFHLHVIRRRQAAGVAFLLRSRPGPAAAPKGCRTGWSDLARLGLSLVVDRAKDDLAASDGRQIHPLIAAHGAAAWALGQGEGVVLSFRTRAALQAHAPRAGPASAPHFRAALLTRSSL